MLRSNAPIPTAAWDMFATRRRRSRLRMTELKTTAHDPYLPENIEYSKNYSLVTLPNDQNVPSLSQIVSNPPALAQHRK